MHEGMARDTQTVTALLTLCALSDDDAPAWPS